MDKDLLKGFKIGFGFLGVVFGVSLLLFGFVYAVGFHTANEILGGTFSGNYSFMDGNVGIGTNNPQSALDVNGNISINGGILYIKNNTVDTNTLLLISSEKNNGNTTFEDSSSNNHVITGYNQVQHSTGSAALGSSSILFDGTGDYITIPNSPNWDFGTGDFTIDFWIKTNTYGVKTTYSMRVLSRGVHTTAEHIGMYINTANDFAFIVGTQENTVSQGISDNQWHHIAAVRNSGTLKIYVDGIQKLSTTNTVNIVGTYELVLGAYYPKDGGWFDGSIEEFRISNVARWTSNFDVPDSPYEGTPLYFKKLDGTSVLIG